MSRRFGRVLLTATAACAAMASVAPPGAAATPTVIRIGGPSSPGDSKVAIVASERNLSGARFRVTEGNRTVLRGRLTRAPGLSAPWNHAFRADLSAVDDPGSYRVRAAGLVSRPWVVRIGGSSNLIALIRRYLRTNRDGNEPALLHGPAHLNDARVKGGPHDGQQIDLTGGWMDAGDMIHFGQTTSFSALLLQAAARLDPANAAALNEEADVGVRWLLKAHPFPDLFVHQVGDARDHERGFRDPASDDGSGVPGIAVRIAYHVNFGVGADVAGKTAAVLAMAADREPDPGRRATLIQQAREWYAGGQASRRPTPDPGGFYPSDTWEPSMAAGAAALFRTTGEAQFLTDALAYLRASNRYDLLDFTNPSHIAAADICGRLGAPPLGDADSQRFACRFLREGATAMPEYARQNAFGPPGYFTWGTTSSVGAGGVQAALSGSRRLAAAARDFILGRNAWGASFVAGFGPRNPRSIHHWAVVFGARQPLGAVVGGPAPLSEICAQPFGAPGGPMRAFNSHGSRCRPNIPDRALAYEDHRRNYVTSEPAIDYASTVILLLATL